MLSRSDREWKEGRERTAGSVGAGEDISVGEWKEGRERIANSVGAGEDISVGPPKKLRAYI